MLRAFHGLLDQVLGCTTEKLYSIVGIAIARRSLLRLERSDIATPTTMLRSQVSTNHHDVLIYVTVCSPKARPGNSSQTHLRHRTKPRKHPEEARGVVSHARNQTIDIDIPSLLNQTSPFTISPHHHVRQRSCHKSARERSRRAECNPRRHRR